jgi:sigma-B regulation protein RsbU (phosphoserine phosphatase)
MATPAPEHPVTVLLVDDQSIVAAAVRQMLADQPDIQFHFCSDPSKALETANTVKPTVILQDLVMPDIDGLTLVKFYRANAGTRLTPLIVLSSKEEPAIKAQAFANGANDYLVKLPDKLEVLARIRYHSRGYIALLERNEAYRKLEERERLLAEEIAQATKYVISLLPAPWKTGPVLIDWRYIPSTTLGGDSFGYEWIDPDHLAIYLLDVSGHGVGASLLSVSAMNVIANRTLPGCDFRDPEAVLGGLNNAFQMDKQNNKYFTIWYGVYHKPSRVLRYAGAGHPSPLLLAPGTARKELPSDGPVVGMLPDMPFPGTQTDVPPGGRLVLFSDGVYEVEQTGGRMWDYSEFATFMNDLPPTPSIIDALYAHVQQLGGKPTLADDFSMVVAEFGSNV